MIAPLDLHFSILYNVLKKHVMEDAEYKVSYLQLLASFCLEEFQCCSVKKYF
jgi:hypothetical protein